jgi:hypothetical protein
MNHIVGLLNIIIMCFMYEREDDVIWHDYYYVKE